MATTPSSTKPIGYIDEDVENYELGANVEEEEDYEQNPHDNEDYECEECGDCVECCNVGDCTSKNSFSNQGDWKDDSGLYFSCPHCEPYEGASRPVIADERYECKGWPGIIDDVFNLFLKRVPVEELIEKGLFVPE